MFVFGRRDNNRCRRVRCGGRVGKLLQNLPEWETAEGSFRLWSLVLGGTGRRSLLERGREEVQGVPEDPGTQVLAEDGMKSVETRKGF